MLGFGALVRGLKARRGTHLTCGSCQYDLSNAPSLPDLPEVCPECGSTVRARSNFNRGVRAPSMRLVWSGAIMLALGTVPLIGIVAGVNFQAMQPNALLQLRGDPESIAILTGRIALGDVDPNRVRGLVHRALEIQADPARLWFPQWGELLEVSRIAGHVSDSEWTAYCKTGLAGVQFHPIGPVVVVDGRGRTITIEPLGQRVRWVGTVTRVAQNGTVEISCNPIRCTVESIGEVDCSSASLLEQATVRLSNGESFVPRQTEKSAWRGKRFTITLEFRDSYRHAAAPPLWTQEFSGVMPER